jgi:hypothetical protein
MPDERGNASPDRPSLDVQVNKKQTHLAQSLSISDNRVQGIKDHAFRGIGQFSAFEKFTNAGAQRNDNQAIIRLMALDGAGLT